MESREGGTATRRTVRMEHRRCNGDLTLASLRYCMKQDRSDRSRFSNCARNISTRPIDVEEDSVLVNDPTDLTILDTPCRSSLPL